ncbi:MupG family TIM beta-alpha barrel fold protein [Spiroplasma diminutum]|uniref:Outer surface protein n=1 Tax=Spiroplasma diminutum CUAS-1 TaxID=1276221 RepID=S5M045_9MOLU|nr:MupG family TIM beta-alpha barrel fold protein [Spiroplasma diminutum]AGR42206.1 outer surface protein [Spiroplasma diminutum CUAS-1]
MNNISKQLGISIYPEKLEMKEIIEYLDLAKTYSFDLLFINFIDILEQKNSELLEKYKDTINEAKKRGYYITIDVNKSTFDSININYKNPDLLFFKELNIDCLRLDDQFNGIFESHLTYNSYNIKIELNCSTFNEHIRNIISYGANTQNLQALHNFYPQRHSGLDYKLFKKYNDDIKKMGLRMGAFVTITDHESVGPWDVSENLPTLEMHRDLEIGLQVNHFLSNSFVSYIYISTQCANKKDFESIIKHFDFRKHIKVSLEKDVTKEELEIIDYGNHFVRGDIAQNILRSTTTRVLYKDFDIKPRNYNNEIIPAGSLVIPNNNYNKYKGELQIVKHDIPNDGLRNVVGRLDDKMNYILDEITPWTHFKIIPND